MATKKSKGSSRTGLSEGLIKELAENVVRNAIGEQARALEEHLSAIHKRLVALETKR